MKISTRPHFPKKEIEDRTFWEKHINAQEKSDVSKLSYCRQNQVDYARFKYWIKIKREGSSKKRLIAVKLKSIECKPLSAPLLCSLLLKNGITLHIHNEQALTFILDRMLAC